MSRDSEGYRAAVALTAARLRGDTEGEEAIADGCCADCRPLLDGLLSVAEIAIKGTATHDKIPLSKAAEVLDFHLWQLSRNAR